MFRRGGLIALVFIFSFLLVTPGILAQTEDIFQGLEEEFGEVEFDANAGTTPDSAFYFVDKIFDNFADDVDVRQEKVAEIRAMIEAGNFEAAREALERYKEHAENLEREVSPEQRDEARRSAIAIYNVLRSLEAQIPEGDRDEFVEDVIEREGGIVTAVEIASKIKELCETLSELNPVEYSRVCRTGDDDPRWHRDLDRDLTEEQRKEAEAFFDIMVQCFETSGETCRCEDISVKPFADKCSVIAPLAFACDVEGDEAACDKMDEIEDESPIEDLLPDYLRDVLERIEDKFDDEQFDNHAPKECREVGANTREECEKVMFRLYAPSECVDAVERGEINIRNEREAREACERIMFDLEAPQECLDAGLTDFRECGKLMFRLNAPQKCIDAGLTGENRNDERSCRELVGDDFDRSGPNRGPGSFTDFNCRDIPNSEERLECYDKAASQATSSHGGFDDSNYDGPCFTESDWNNKKQECRNLYGDHAGDEPRYGDSGEGYDCVIDVKCVDFGQYKDDDFEESTGPNPWEGCETIYCQPGSYCEYGQCKAFEVDEEVFSECKDGCLDDCPGASRTDCVDGGLKCACYYDEPTPEPTPALEPVPEPIPPEPVPTP